MFDKQDEEDDFNGVDHGSRDVIRNVAAVIDQVLRESRFMMIFLNGSDDEIVLNRFGIPEYRDCIILWTFKRRFMTMHHHYYKTSDKLRYTDLFLFGGLGHLELLSSSQLSALFWEEAANLAACYPCMRDINLAVVIDCCLYGLFLYYSLDSTNRSGWADHNPNHWICDGIIQGDRAREMSNALHREISFECDDSLLGTVYHKIQKGFGTPFLVTQSDMDFHFSYRKMHAYRWISINSKNDRYISKKEVHDGMLEIVACASSIFLSSERTESPLILQNVLFEQCRIVLRVLVLSYCGFSFVSPPFICCQTLRFLGLDHCTNHNKNQLEGEGCTATEWAACLCNLWVLDQRYTDWDEILSEEKLGLMCNLIELNIEGVRCWQYTSQLQKRLPHLERLRITKPVCQAEFSKDIISNSFTEKKKLELLDFSGNTEMRNLPTSLSMASNLQVLILDGCDQLENVALPNGLPSSLRSFSFDGCGPASNWTSSTDLPSESSRPKCASDADKKDVKTTMISLEGCKLLENLFLRGLPNLEELDLSGSAIKILDFKTMVVDVPRLKRLFLIGCEHLRAIIWGDKGGSLKPWKLELLCVDTRAGAGGSLGCMDRPSLISQHKSSRLKPQRHATITDARLVRSLSATINHDSYYRINITSSSTLCGSVEETNNDMIESSYASSCDHQRHHVLAAGLYGDAFNKVGDTPTLMQDFPHPPTPQLDCHIEIGNGSRNVQSEAEADAYDDNLCFLMRNWTESMHMHDVSAYSNTMALGSWYNLKWCRIERCSNLEAVFPPGAQEGNNMLETIWASDLLKARCIWSQGIHDSWYFQSLGHLHLRSCPSLRFAIPVFFPSFPRLETIHIIHCSDLRHVFAVERKSQTSVKFPRLTTIHLYDLPALHQICEVAETLTPVLETIKIRGCPNLRRLPALKGRELGMRRPTVEEVEKDVWDALKWDGVDAGHHPSLYETHVHSRYYKRRLLRRTVLR
ncbi:unnamed protein product [Urochloa decumbens]|uniref:Disease resistance protein At4g27190-like leucine-rich repeats domain-containing protein n=1 Tax=Urochloa decumbens TaxID=240449 RepID=A0ABC9BZY8_9POAL